MQKTAALEPERDEISAIVAYNLREQMKGQRWSGRAFATSLGLPPAYIQRRMSGDSELSATDLKVFAEKLGVKIQDFYKVPPTGIEPATYGTYVRRLDDYRTVTPIDDIDAVRDELAVILPFPGVA